MGCATGLARMLLILFNVIFWLSGAAILGVGIWILVDPNIEDTIDVISKDEDYFRYAAYILLAFGSFVFLVGFAGCCGAIKNSKCLLGLYIFFLLLVFAGELAAGILAAIYKDEIKDELDKDLRDSIKDDYKDNPKSWDSVQKELKCCGGTGPDDYKNSTWRGEVKKQNSSIEIPESCCSGMKELCQNRTEGYYYKTGCVDQLKDWVEDHSIILIGVGCGIAALQIFGLIFAICLCRSIDEATLK